MCEMHLKVPKFDVVPIAIRYRVTGVSELDQKRHSSVMADVVSCSCGCRKYIGKMHIPRPQEKKKHRNKPKLQLVLPTVAGVQRHAHARVFGNYEEMSAKTMETNGGNGKC